ncbi:extracellular solute-binding protein [Microbacterium sp. KUDC0406]|uniref:ABC transporter substrate-binding protein n=1 Tax=Microbacterium sp. KUDC0406 TaxID=2909588 RepID=UPI001F2812AA|nr:extracellular solute-binding protein [Microbacterium sp. KUDC0406]UJP09878.1 extracellular solute-binding protein [Microbacterium sp. KUDC0406]
MKFRSILAAGVAASVAVVLAGCTGGGAPQSDGSSDGEITGKITFQTWSLKNDKFTPYFNDVIAAFEKEHKGVEVNWIDQPADGYEDKILQQAESGELPDVVNLPPEYAGELAKASQLVDLKKADSKTLEEYVEGGLEGYTYEGIDGTYAYPWYLGTNLNYWNMELLGKGGFTAPPKTFEETLDDADVLATKGVQTMSDIPDVKALQWMVTDGGGEYPFAVDGKFMFDTPEAEAIIDRYHELYKAGGVSPEALQGAGTANNNVNNFNKGSVAWTTAGPNYIDKNLAVNAPTLLPAVKAGPGFGDAPLFLQGISVASGSKNSATALAFAEYVTNTENQVEFVKLAAGFFPGTKAANEDPSAFAETAQNPEQAEATKYAAAQMSTARITGGSAALSFTEEMNTYAKQQIALAVRGDISAKEALTKGQDYANQNVTK